MDFTRLHNESNIYWNQRDYQSAILTLQAIDSYISNGLMDTFLVSYNYILQPENLLSLYAVQTNQNMIILNQTISYTDLMLWFRNYIQGLINEIVDYQKKLKAQNELTAFDKILNAAANILSFLSDPAILALIAAIILYFIFFHKNN